MRKIEFYKVYLISNQGNCGIQRHRFDVYQVQRNRIQFEQYKNSIPSSSLPFPSLCSLLSRLGQPWTGPIFLLLPPWCWDYMCELLLYFLIFPRVVILKLLVFSSLQYLKKRGEPLEVFVYKGYDICEKLAFVSFKRKIKKFHSKLLIFPSIMGKIA